ncbi:MAG: alkaline phosphatase [Kiritimatiellales bacterium]|nr:alkaline phosphatase [Kiritimatiellales bacterium]
MKSARFVIKLLLIGVLAADGLAAPIRNIILCIGDGMGPEQVKAAGYYAGTNLFFETFPHQSAMATASADNSVTDSAAAATAMASGQKVNNGVISLTLPGDGSELQTLLEYFKTKDKAVGLVTTTYMTHATPAAFGAHTTSRNNTSEIAADYLTQTRPQVLFGGGGNGMSPSAAVDAGYTVVTTRDELFALNTKATSLVSGQFGQTHLPYEVDGLGELPRLPEMAAVALDILDNDPDGFFLMVEGGRIDHAGHANNLVRNIGETLAFSETVETVYNWAAGRTDTLILVMADHETGGLDVLADNGPGEYPTVTWSTTGHTATPAPVYAWGLNADLAAAVADNTEIHQVAVSTALIPEKMLNVGLASGGGMQITWTASAGDTYRAEYTVGLGPSEWTPLITVTADSSRLVIVDTNAAPRCFYRLIPLGAENP